MLGLFSKNHSEKKEHKKDDEKNNLKEDEKKEVPRSLTIDLEHVGFSFKDANYVHRQYDKEGCLQLYQFDDHFSYRRLIYFFQRKDKDPHVKKLYEDHGLDHKDLSLKKIYEDYGIDHSHFLFF